MPLCVCVFGSVLDGSDSDMVLGFGALSVMWYSERSSF